MDQCLSVLLLMLEERTPGHVSCGEVSRDFCNRGSRFLAVMTRNSKLPGPYDLALLFGLADGGRGCNTAPEAMVRDLPRVVTVDLIPFSDRLSSLSFSDLLSLTPRVIGPPEVD